MIDVYSPADIAKTEALLRRPIEQMARVQHLLDKARDRPFIEAMARQNFTDLTADPQVVNSTALVATTIEAMWPAAQFSYIPAGTGTLGKIYEIMAGGIFSTGASGTLTITPSIGTATGGATLGASIAQTVTPSITNEAWFLHAVFVVRSVTSPNAVAGSMAGTGVWWGGGAAATAASNNTIGFGGTSAAFDTTAAPAASTGAITIAKTLSVAGSLQTFYAFMRQPN